MEEQTESWPLESGLWHRDPGSDTWRFAASADGTVVNTKLPEQDVRRMVGARRDTTTGQWFPPDFNYSPQTGTQLHDTIVGIAPSEADQYRPALPPGQYQFLFHKLDLTSSNLVAIEPQKGELLLLLPESKTWVPLEGNDGVTLAPRQKNFRGWRMEVAGNDGSATLYFPTASGLAAVTPTVIGLAYTVEYFGEGPAFGGPVAWEGAIWLPQAGKNGTVDLIGKTLGAGDLAVLETGVAAPRHGFEAPVFDSLHVIWPCEEGQLIVRLNQAGQTKTDWIAWPDGLTPVFSSGSPLFLDSFWQRCRTDENAPLEYVQMGKVFAQRKSSEELEIGAPG